MRRLLELFHREFKGVREAAFLLAMATVASNLLALLRDRLLASRFGAGLELDIYYAAFRVPDFLYTISLFFVASTAIIPLFLEKLAESEERATEFIRSVFFAFLLSMIGIIGVAYAVMPLLMPLLVPGFDEASRAQAIQLARILLASPALLGLSNLVSSILQSYRKFLPYAASFLFYNLGIILGILFFVPYFGIAGLAGGVVLGALLHVGIQIPSLQKTIGGETSVNLRMFRLRWRATIPLEVFRRSFPRTLGLAATQLTFFAVTAIASTLGAGSIAVFQLSYNLQSIPLAVVGLSYSVAAFPTMAELIVKKERAIFFDHLVSAARHIIFWTLPITVLFIVLRAHIVRVVLGAGAFSWVDTRLTAASVALFAIGIVAQSLVALFVRAFYAIGNTRVPVVVNVASAVLTVILALFFVQVLKEAQGIGQFFSGLLRVGDIENHALLGLPLAFALGAVVNAAILGLSLGWVEGEFSPSKLGASAADIAGASILLGIVTYGTLQLLSPFFYLNRFWGIFLHGLIAAGAGITAAVLLLYLRDNKEFAEIRDVIGHKFWRKKTIGPEQEHL